MLFRFAVTSFSIFCILYSQEKLTDSFIFLKFSSQALVSRFCWSCNILIEEGDPSFNSFGKSLCKIGTIL